MGPVEPSGRRPFSPSRNTPDSTSASAAPPSARGSLLLGTTLDLQRDQLGTYARAMAEHGDIARFRVGPPRVGFTFDAVFSPEGARQVLAADAAHYIKDARCRAASSSCSRRL